MTSDVTPRLNLPLIAAQQAQKHVTHNEALRDLDALVQATVKNRDLASPPASPQEGDCYIVAASATDVWAGHENELAEYRNGGWVFHAPAAGWLVFVEDEAAFFFFDGTTWQSLTAAITATLKFLKLGVNTTADDTNRLAVKSDAVLFSHDDITPGTGDVRFTINKKSAGNTASLLFQDNWSGRAEIGLAGDDNFRFKVSPDGGGWLQGLVIDSVTGSLSFPLTPMANNLLINGDFAINQRGFAGGALAAGVYGYDRWKAASGGANISVSNGVVTLESGAIEQVIELPLFGLSDLQGKHVVVSVENPSADIQISFAGEVGIIPSGTGRRYTSLYLGSSTGEFPILKIEGLGGGSVSFSRVQMELGREPSGWNYRPIESALCYRYYLQLGPSVSWRAFFLAVAGDMDRIFGTIIFPIPMRSAPILRAQGAIKASAGEVIRNFDSMWFYGDNVGGELGIRKNGAFVPGKSYFVQAENDSSAYIAFDAEL